MAGAKSARTGDVVHFHCQVRSWQTTSPHDGLSAAAQQPSIKTVNSSPKDPGLTSSRQLPETFPTVLRSSITPRNVQREIKVVGRVPFKEFQGAEQWIIGNYAYYSTISDRFLVYDISNPTQTEVN